MPRKLSTPTKAPFRSAAPKGGASLSALLGSRPRGRMPASAAAMASPPLEILMAKGGAVREHYQLATTGGVKGLGKKR